MLDISLLPLTDIIFQDVLPEGATIVLILLGVDETHLTVLGNTTCKPLYLTIRNLPKKVRQTYSCNTYALLAYLPILETTGREADKGVFTQAKRVLYHKCLQVILQSLNNATERYL